MPSKVTASLVVNFGVAGGGGVLSIELDTRPDGLNAGKSTFIAGDSPAVLVFHSEDVTIDTVEASAGTIEDLGGGLYDVGEDGQEYVQFPDVAEASISRPFYSGLEYRWIGANLGAITLRETQARIAAAGVGIVRLQYKALYHAYRINDIDVPGETTFPVLVVVTGTKA